MKTFVGKSALVTGVSRGIGTFIARTLAKAGAEIIGIARSTNGLKKLKKEILALGGKIKIISFDLNKIEELSELIANLNLNHHIDILVNNAGIEKYKHYSDNSLQSIESIINVNLLAPMEITRLLLPRMLKRESGNIVNIASLAGKKGVAYNSIYSASKAGMIKWSDGLRQELHKTGVSVSTIMPGYINKAGMFFDGGQKAPMLLGTSSPQNVADAVMKAIKTGKGEIIVNKGLIKPLLSLNIFSPKLGDFIVRKFGIINLSKKRIN